MAREIPVARDTKSKVDLPCATGLDAIYREHFEFVWCVLRRLGVDDADIDDATQDVFVIAHRRLAQFEGRAAVRTWLYSIAIRVAANRRRKHARRDALLVRLPRATPDDLEELAARGQARAILEALLDRLDEHKRAVFVLAELEEMTVPAIAEIVGENPRTVYSRLRAARARVASELDRLHAPQPLGIDAAILASRPRAAIPEARARRAWAAVLARLGLDAVPRLAAPGLGLAAKLAIASGLVGAVTWVGAASIEPAAPPVAIATPRVEAPPSAPPPVAPDLRAIAPASPPEVARSVAPSPVPPRSVDAPARAPAAQPRIASEPSSLADETAMIDRARAFVAAGRADAALAELDRHAARFVAGALRPEADGVRITALCGADREPEAIAYAKANGLPSPRCGAAR